MGTSDFIKTMGQGFGRTMTLGLATVFALSGCTSQSATTSTPALKDNFQAEIQLDKVLSIRGVDFSIEELSSLPGSQLEVFEPFAKSDTSFEVIDFGQLLLASGFSFRDRVETIALNDYRYTDSVQSFVDNGALLAIFENGEPIPVSRGGPIRIVFAESSPYYSYLDAWNWSLSSIELEAE